MDTEKNKQMQSKPFKFLENKEEQLKYKEKEKMDSQLEQSLNNFGIDIEQYKQSQEVETKDYLEEKKEQA